ncbi:MAG: ABC transporter permease [Chloroflexi bacterium]|nr:ABC transporter permease [Chloroflexota bacterium]MCL5075406.1 ABC transporter permease [Chloroflexota bacterium]
MSKQASAIPITYRSLLADAVRSLTRRTQIGNLLLILPASAFLTGLFAYPLMRIFMLSLFDPDLTLKHYAYLLQKPAYIAVLLNTFRLAFTVTLSCLVLGYPFAYLLANASPRVRNILMIAVILPFLTSLLVRTYAWMVLLGREGLINQLLLKSGLVSSPLQLMHNFIGVHVGMVQILIPYMILPLFSVMVGIDKSLLKAAYNLGATPFQAFWRIFLPLSLPGVAAGSILVFIISLGFFVTPALLGGLRDTTISMLIETQTSQLLNWGFASVLAVVLLVITLLLATTFNQFLGLDKIWGGRT